MRFRCFSSITIACASFIGVVGCAKGPVIPQVVPVKGIVTLDGQPLAGASLTFYPGDNSTKNGTANSDDKGEFEVLTYFDSTHILKGVVAGEYKVTVTKMLDSSAPEPVIAHPKKEDRAKMEADRIKQMEQYAKNKESKKGVPEKYTKPGTSGLKAVVTTGMEPLKLELKN